jgi:excisionase family DNA binding protein
MNQTGPHSEARLLRFRDAAAFLGVSPSTLYEFVHRGALQPVRLAGLRGLRFDLRDLESFIEHQKEVGALEATEQVSNYQQQNPNRRRTMP